MQKNGIPVTRDNYMSIAYPEGRPSPWTAEDEEGLPASLQDWDRFVERLPSQRKNVR